MSSSDEYATPKKYVESARYLMNGIDLDPTTTEFVNKRTVQANKFWTKEDDALSKEVWRADSVFMNPPYSRDAGTAAPFVNRLLHSWKTGRVGEAVILLNNVAANKWWQPLWDFPICFCSPRINFLQKEGDELREQSSPRYDNAFIYLPEDLKPKPVLEFQSLFEKYGHVTNIFHWLKPLSLKKAVKQYKEVKWSTRDKISS